MKHGPLLVGILLAIIASAATTGGLLVLAQDQGDPPKSEPSKALKPSEVIKLPQGTPATQLTLPYDYGQFRIVAPGGTFHQGCYSEPPGRTRVKQITKTLVPEDMPAPRDVVEGPGGQVIITVRSLDELKDHALFIEPPYVPSGWEVYSAETFSSTWDDGSQTDAGFLLMYDQPGYFPIKVHRFHIGPDCQFEVTDFGRIPDTKQAITLSDIRGVPAVVQHQAPGVEIQATLRVTFILDGVVTEVEGVAIDLDELVGMAEAVIVGLQGGTP